jgi:hypothetical protein
VVVVTVLVGSTVSGVTNVDTTFKYGWGENIGWTNWRDANGGADGVRLLPTHLSGYAWGENVGWIHLGDGTPTNGLYYANVDGTDYGVNLDPTTNKLYGLAWGENIGWINFDTFAQLNAFGEHARYDPPANRLRGYAWGENVGWINLDDSTQYVAIVPPACANPYANTDADIDVDLDDFAEFQLCRTGVNGGIPDDCECFNRPESGYPIGDNDIDDDDLDKFDLCYSGPTVPLIATCDD